MSDNAWIIRPPQASAASQAAAPSGAKRAAGKTGKDFASVMSAQTTPIVDNSLVETALAAPKKGFKKVDPASANGIPGIPLHRESAQLGGMPVHATGNNRVSLAGRSPSDMARSQVFGKAQVDIRQMQAVNGLMQSLNSSSSTLDLARSMGTARHLHSLTQGKGLNFSAPQQSHQTAQDGSEVVKGAQSGKSGKSGKSGRSGKKEAQQATAAPERSGIGMLSARFESGGDGIAAIGYDRVGGTSYGKYQIASRVGSMKSFLGFLDGTAPDIADRLRKAGPANTGSRRGAMPTEWRKIAAEQPERFEALQEAFIHESHYKPALESIVQRTGLEMDKISPAMSEVIWSTAVQHGPAGAARIFDRADDASGKPNQPGYERKLISNVYKLRAGQFGSSSSQVQEAVRNRFREEKTLALNMLNDSQTLASLA